MKIFFLMLLCLILFSSCSKETTEEGEYEYPSFEYNQEEFTIEDIKNALYSDYKFPDGFSWEEIKKEYELKYLSTIDIDSIGPRPLDYKGEDCQIKYDSINYCVDYGLIILDSKTIDEALIYANRFIHIYIGNDNGYVQLIESKASLKYFEFTYHLPEKYCIRINNTAYLTSNNYDIENNISAEYKIIGKYNDDDYSIDKIKELLEYIFFIEVNGRVDAVLSSFIKEDDSYFYLYNYSIVVWSHFDKTENDLILLQKRIFKIDKSTGVIERSTIFSIKE